MFYLMTTLFVLLLWALFYVVLATVQQALDNRQRARRLRHRIDRIAGVSFWF